MEANVKPKTIGSQLEADELKSLDKVAKRLDVSIWTIRRWVQDGRLASIRLGARRLISESEVQRVIREGL
jgi:excisionase family DNA binding protein